METAITVPMMVFFVLGTVQLGMMHHAQLRTDYAAYRAVRAGIVSNGDCQLMTQAARVSLIPTYASRSDTIARAHATSLSHPASKSSLMARLAGGELNVEILNPRSNELNGLFNTYGAHLNRQEIWLLGPSAARRASLFRLSRGLQNVQFSVTSSPVPETGLRVAVKLP